MTSSSKISIGVPRIVVPRRHFDDRGWFSETFNKSRLRDVGISCDFVQENQSSSTRAGTLRGLHFQLPPAAQAKLVIVVRGKIVDVAVDIRCGSPTYGKHIATEISAESGHQLYVPVGFAHGFLTLEDNVLVTYKVSHNYSPAHDAGIRWNDPDIAFPWPIKEADVILSEKDRQLPFLSEFSSPFSYDGNPLAALPVSNIG
jgi:dTDP-4-dehydrorhamnose 3,5-epimerase